MEVSLMGRTRKHCRICRHEDRAELDRQLAELEITPEALDEKMEWPSGVSARHLRNHLGGEYNDNSNPSCKVCVDEKRSTIEQQLHDGEISPTDLAEEVGTTRQQVIKHMEKHLKPIVQKSAALEIMKKDMDEIDVLSTNIARLESKIAVLFEEDDLTPKYIDSLTKLAKEVRESLKYMLEFKGQLVSKRQDTVIIAQMNIVQEVLAQNHPDVWIDVKNKMQERLQ